MTLKELIWGKKVKYTFIGIGTAVTTLLFTKALYDYTMYSNLKYVKKQLKHIGDEIG